MYTAMPLGQAATIRTVDALREELLAAFQSGPDQNGSGLELDASELVEVDLAFVQLIEAARQHAAGEGKAIRLTAPANPALAALLGRAGLIDGATPDDLEFWFHGELPQ